MAKSKTQDADRTDSDLIREAVDQGKLSAKDAVAWIKENHGRTVRGGTIRGRQGPRRPRAQDAHGPR